MQSCNSGDCAGAIRHAKRIRTSDEDARKGDLAELKDGLAVGDLRVVKQLRVWMALHPWSRFSSSQQISKEDVKGYLSILARRLPEGMSQFLELVDAFSGHDHDLAFGDEDNTWIPKDRFSSLLVGHLEVLSKGIDPHDVHSLSRNEDLERALLFFESFHEDFVCLPGDILYELVFRCRILRLWSLFESLRQDIGTDAEDFDVLKILRRYVMQALDTDLISSQDVLAVTPLCACSPGMRLSLMTRASRDSVNTMRKIQAINAGLFGVALQHFMSGKTEEDAALVLAWCYPGEPDDDSRQLRKELTDMGMFSCDDFKAPAIQGRILTQRDLSDSVPELAYHDLLMDALSYVAVQGTPQQRQKLHEHLNKALLGELKKLKQEHEEMSDSDVDVTQMDSAWHNMRCGSQFRFLLNDYSQTIKFKVRVRYLKYLLSIIEDRQGDVDPILLVVPREGITEGVCRRLGIGDAGTFEASPPNGLLQIEFRDEDGQDQGGLRRSWLELAARHFVRSDLFMSLEEDAAHLQSCGPLANCRLLGGRRWVPAPVSVCQAVQADWEAQFVLLGSILGFALLHGEVLPVKFARHFMQLVLGGPSQADAEAGKYFDELRKVDETLAQKMESILAGDYSGIFGVENLPEALEAAGLPKTFVARDSKSPELTGSTELGSGGANRTVDEGNKKEFLQRTAHFHVAQSISHQAALVRKGMLRILCPKLLELGDTDEVLGVLCTSEEREGFARAETLYLVQRCFSGDEIERLIAGEDRLDLDAWRKCTRYKRGYRPDSPTVLSFWTVVAAFDAKEQSQLLSFVRGSSALPVGGFSELHFIIRRVGGGPDRLPAAHTCEFSLDLPEYGTSEQLAAKLRTAMAEETFAVG